MDSGRNSPDPFVNTGGLFYEQEILYCDPESKTNLRYRIKSTFLQTISSESTSKPDIKSWQSFHVSESTLINDSDSPTSPRLSMVNCAPERDIHDESNMPLNPIDPLHASRNWPCPVQNADLFSGQHKHLYPAPMLPVPFQGSYWNSLDLQLQQCHSFQDLMTYGCCISDGLSTKEHNALFSVPEHPGDLKNDHGPYTHLLTSSVSMANSLACTSNDSIYSWLTEFNSEKTFVFQSCPQLCQSSSQSEPFVKHSLSWSTPEKLYPKCIVDKLRGTNIRPMKRSTTARSLPNTIQKKDLRQNGEFVLANARIVRDKMNEYFHSGRPHMTPTSLTIDTRMTGHYLLDDGETDQDATVHKKSQIYTNLFETIPFGNKEDGLCVFNITGVSSTFSLRPKQRVLKGRNVEKACNHCKKSHLRCDDMRPCRRCSSSGKIDCKDVEHKPRGRPKLTQRQEIAKHVDSTLLHLETLKKPY